jgi:hypothetical protein
MLLDIVEVAKSHTGENLAAAFAKIMDEYGISEKVISIPKYIYIFILILLTRFWGLHAITLVTMIPWLKV